MKILGSALFVATGGFLCAAAELSYGREQPVGDENDRDWAETMCLSSSGGTVLQTEWARLAQISPTDPTE